MTTQTEQTLDDSIIAEMKNEYKEFYPPACGKMGAILTIIENILATSSDDEQTVHYITRVIENAKIPKAAK